MAYFMFAYNYTKKMGINYKLYALCAWTTMYLRFFWCIFSLNNNKIIKDSTLTLKIIDTLIEIKSNSIFIADTLKLNKNSNQYIEFVFRKKSSIVFNT